MLNLTKTVIGIYSRRGLKKAGEGMRGQKIAEDNGEMASLVALGMQKSSAKIKDLGKFRKGWRRRNKAKRNLLSQEYE